jgi:hypothetical protein
MEWKLCYLVDALESPSRRARESSETRPGSSAPNEACSGGLFGTSRALCQLIRRAKPLIKSQTPQLRCDFDEQRNYASSALLPGLTIAFSVRGSFERLAIFQQARSSAASFSHIVRSTSKYLLFPSTPNVMQIS